MKLLIKDLETLRYRKNQLIAEQKVLEEKMVSDFNDVKDHVFSYLNPDQQKDSGMPLLESIFSIQTLGEAIAKTISGLMDKDNERSVVPEFATNMFSTLRNKYNEKFRSFLSGILK